MKLFYIDDNLDNLLIECKIYSKPLLKLNKKKESNFFDICASFLRENSLIFYL